jgi:hypothetical protein
MNLSWSACTSLVVLVLLVLVVLLTVAATGVSITPLIVMMAS